MSRPNFDGITQSFAGDADYAKMQALLSTILELGDAPCYTTAGDLDWWFCRTDDSHFLSTVAIWQKGDQLLAFSWPSRGWPMEFFADVFVHPDYPELLRTVVEFGEAWCIREGGKQFGVWSFDSDKQRVRLIESCGYKVDSEMGAYRLCLLDNEPNVPVLPEGYTVGAIRDEDVTSRVKAQQNAFDSDLTVEQYERVRKSATYRANLDIGVKSPEGEIVAFCIVWLDERNSYAVFEPVGCHKAYQRRGLGTVALKEGQHRLWQMGVKRACVLGAQPGTPNGAFYQAAGFDAKDSLRMYAKAFKAESTSG